jgi:hypothetical protein
MSNRNDRMHTLLWVLVFAIVALFLVTPAKATGIYHLESQYFDEIRQRTVCIYRDPVRDFVLVRELPGRQYCARAIS